MRTNIILDNNLVQEAFKYCRANTQKGAHSPGTEGIRRKKGLTVRSTVDCMIAQIAIENELLLLHNDRDFEAMAAVAPLKLFNTKHNKEYMI